MGKEDTGKRIDIPDIRDHIVLEDRVLWEELTKGYDEKNRDLRYKILMMRILSINNAYTPIVVPVDAHVRRLLKK